MVVAVMTMVEVVPVVTMMTPPVCVGVEHLRAEGRALDHRRRRRLVGIAGSRRERRRGENGNGEQRRGNRLEHFFSSFKDSAKRSARSPVSGFADHVKEDMQTALNPC
jgi:hypothetical protein